MELGRYMEDLIDNKYLIMGQIGYVLLNKDVNDDNGLRKLRLKDIDRLDVLFKQLEDIECELDYLKQHEAELLKKINEYDILNCF